MTLKSSLCLYPPKMFVSQYNPICIVQVLNIIFSHVITNNGNIQSGNS